MRYCDISCIRDFLSNAFFAAAAKVTLFSFVCEILGFHNHWIVWDVAVVAIDSIIFYIYIYIYIPISIFVCFYPHLTPLSLALNDSKLGVSETKKCRNNKFMYRISSNYIKVIGIIDMRPSIRKLYVIRDSAIMTEILNYPKLLGTLLATQHI